MAADDSDDICVVHEPLSAPCTAVPVLYMKPVKGSEDLWLLGHRHVVDCRALHSVVLSGNEVQDVV